MTRAALGGLALVVALAGCQGQAKPKAPVAEAVRGNLEVTVGGVGRIVAARTSAPIVMPATATPTQGAATPVSSSAPAADAVFARTSGRVARLLVAAGQRVTAGQPLAVLDDGGSAELALRQAETDLASARLELAQKRTSDPSKGLPPSPAELAAGELGVTAAREKLTVVNGPPKAADVTAARLDLRKAESDLEILQRAPSVAALAAAQLAIDVANQKLTQVSGPPTQVDLTAAQLELKKAQAELETLRQGPPGPGAAALEAARLAVELAKQKLADLDPAAPQSEVLAARLEVSKAQADLEALQRSAPAATATAIAAAQLAVDLATQKLAQLTGPPNPLVVASAQLDLRKAEAELETLQRLPSVIAVRAAKLAVKLAKQKLARVLGPPLRADLALARLELGRAQADLAVLRARGGPASPTDIGLAGLKVDAARARLALAQFNARQLTVLAPWNGTITGLASPGGLVDATAPVATVADVQRLAANVDLSEFDVARVRRGMGAAVSVDALGGSSVRGTVRFVAFTGIDNGGVVTFPVKVGLSHVAGLKPGMNVSVHIVIAKRRNVVRVPLEAVGHDASGSAIVTVVDASGHESPRRVKLGLANNKDVEIKRGLRAGERVALAGTQGG